MLSKTRKRAHIKSILTSLHWLLVSFRIDFNSLLLVYKTFYGFCPSLSELLTFYTPPWTLRSSGARFVIIPRARTKTYEASFDNYSTHLWNDPEELRAAEDMDPFKMQLKTHRFTLNGGCKCRSLPTYILK